MQRIPRTRPYSGRSDGSPRRKRQPTTRCSRRSPASVGVASLAPAYAQALPGLDTVPPSYSHELRGELLYDLCAALVREGLAGPEIWRKCEGSAVAFAQRAIMQAFGEERWNLLQRNVEYHLSVSDVAEQAGEDVPLGKGRLAVTVECGSAGFLKIGPAIAAREEEAAGVGAVFYWTLTYALYRVMRIYNHDDALQYEERMREDAGEDEENRGQYEFPEVERALPECIQRTLIRDDFRSFMRGKPCPACGGQPGISHITDEEMKGLMKSAVDAPYRLLWLREYDPRSYNENLALGRRYTAHWDDPELKNPARQRSSFK